MSPKPPPTSRVISTSAIVPTMNDRLAAANVPTDLPSIELIGACIAIRPPAMTVRRSAVSFVTTSRPSS